MAERFLKVTVSRRQTAEVYIRVDDQHPDHADAFNGTQLSEEAYGVVGDLVKDAIEATLCDSDWESDFPNGSAEVDEIEIVSAKTARQYELFDAAEDAVISEPHAKRACRELREFLGLAEPAREPGTPLQQLREFVGVA